MSDKNKNPNVWVNVSNEYLRAIKFNAYYEYFWSLIYATGIIRLIFFSSDKKATAIFLVIIAVVHHIISTFIASRNAYLILNAFSQKKDDEQE